MRCSTGSRAADKRLYITFSLASRGQRHADTPYAVMFPGLLTDGIEQAVSYIFRGIVADSIRGLQFLLTRRELDPRRVVAVGNDLALITAALQPGATHVVTTPLWATGTPARVLRHVESGTRGLAGGDHPPETPPPSGGLNE